MQKTEIEKPFYVQRIESATEYVKSYLEGLIDGRKIRKEYADRIFEILMKNAAEQEKELSLAYTEKNDEFDLTRRLFWHKAGMQDTSTFPIGPIEFSPGLKSKIYREIESLTNKELISDVPKGIVNEFEKAFLSTLVGERKRRLESWRGYTYPKRRKEREIPSLWLSKRWDYVKLS